MSTTRKRRNNQNADFDDRKFERGAKERAEAPIEFTGYEKRKRCPKGTSWNKGSSSCQPNFSILGDPIGALKETILEKPKSKSKSLSKTKSKSLSKTKTMSKSVSTVLMPKSVSTMLMPKSVSMPKSTKLTTMSKTKTMTPKLTTMSKTKTMTPKSTTMSKTKTMSLSPKFSSKKKSASKSKFMGLDDFYSSNVDLGKKVGINV